MTSEYELRAVLAEGHLGRDIVVNGTAKHHWLPRCRAPELNVNLDSTAEAASLLSLGRDLRWRFGARCAVKEQYDEDDSRFAGQFGLSIDEVQEVLERASRIGAVIDVAHFHLRSDIAEPNAYAHAVEELASICDRVGWRPSIVDFGGGLPAASGKPDGQAVFAGLQRAVTMAANAFPGLREMWMENGRFVTTDSTILVLTVLDTKDRGDSRYLICDGGRVNNALPSDWERHRILVFPERGGQTVLTTVAGPTCMAYDCLGRVPLPRAVGVGDVVCWMDAGAYHLPFETRFSWGLAAVVWADEDGSRVVRDRERFDHWWGPWR